ncbi:MAG: hypothetical protein QXI11_04340, partial [Thermoproteota archaeon]
MEEKKLAGLLLIILVLSLEFNRLVVLRVNPQVEDFVSRLENHLSKAIPEDLLAEECEYVIPEGFDPALAERLWKSLSLYVSTGCTTEELRAELKNVYGDASLVNATLQRGKAIALNISGTIVEKSLDGSVSVKIPVVSSFNLSYARFNFTKKAGFYEAWNKTLVRKYRVWRLEPGWYTYTLVNLEANKSYTALSRIYGEALSVEDVQPGGFHGLPEFEFTRWGWLHDSGPVIAIPGHYEDVSVVIPQQEVKYRVLFPAYDPVVVDGGGWGWVVYTNISSTSVTVGETLEVSYSASYKPPEPVVLSLNGEEPLNATLTLNAPDSFHPLDSLVRRLNETHATGVFRLRAVQPGVYNLTLHIEGNAVFYLSGQEKTYTVQVVSPGSPSLNIQVMDIDTSVLKHARLRLRLSNNGGGAARNVSVRITGSRIESAERTLGDIEAGGAWVGEFMLRLLTEGSGVREALASSMEIRVTYSDDDGNPYAVFFRTPYEKPLVFRNVWVPEHYEEYTTIVPEHEETRRVFVPGYEGATHVRLYAISDASDLWTAMHWGRLKESTRGIERLKEYYGSEFGYVLNLGLTPIPVPGLGVELSIQASEKALSEAGVKIMLANIEPYYDCLGVLSEEEALRLIGTDKDSLRSGNLTFNFRVEPLKPYWAEGKHVVMNSTEFALYKTMMDELKKTNPDIDYDYKETIADVRNKVGSAERGYVALVYRPLKIVGSGSLKTVRIRNYAGVGLNYMVDVETSVFTFFGKKRDGKDWKCLFLDGRGDAVILSTSLEGSYTREVRVSLNYSGRLVAEASFILEPEPSPFWTGFWDGFKSQWLKIVLTGVVMVILNVATGGTVGSLALKLTVLTVISSMILINALSQYQELGQIILASHTFNEFKSIMEEHAREFESLGYLDTASVFREAAGDIQRLIEAVSADLPHWPSILDFASRICTDMSLEEWEILFGIKDADPYNKGFVWGKAIGNAISLVEFLVGFCHLATSGATSASLGAKAKAVLQGVWNWLTPSLTDALSVIRNTPKLAKGFSMLLTIFSNAKKLGKSIIDVLKMDIRGAMNLAGISGGLLEKITELAEKREISDDAAKAIMELCSKATELGEDALGKLNGDMKTILSKNAKFAGEFSSWALRTEANLKWVVETAGELSELDSEELKGLGEALAKVGDSFENGFKLFDTYFKIPDSYKSYGIDAVKEISNVFLENVGKDGIQALEAWSRAITDGGIALRTKVGGTPYPRIWKGIWDSLALKEGDLFTIV